VLARQAIYRNIISELLPSLHFAVYDPLTALCDEAECHAIRDGHVVYSDDNHLGVFGSQWAMRQFVLKPGEQSGGQ
jgi:hypothetical protein